MNCSKVFLFVILFLGWNRIGSTRRVEEEEQRDDFYRNFSIEERDWAFIHIPKTGGSTIASLIWQLFGVRLGPLLYVYHHHHDSAPASSDPVNNNGTLQVNKALYCQRKDPDLIPPCTPSLCPGDKCAWWHLPPYTFLDPPPYFEKPIRFCVLRHPASRILSEFHYGSVAGETSPYYFWKFLKNLNNSVATQNDYKRRKKGNPNNSRNCLLSSEKHCHYIPTSRYVEPYVNFDYIQDLHELLAHPFEKQSCLEIAELLRKKYEKPSPSESTTTTTTKNKPSKKSSTGLNCNFPLRFESLRFDLNNFFRKCLKTEVKHMHHENARGYNPRPYLLPVFFDLIKLIYREDFERFNYQEIKFSNFSVDVVPRDKHPAFTSSRHLSLAMSQLNSSSSSSALEKYWLDLATKVKLINSTFMPPSEKNEKKKELVQFLRSNPFSKNRRTEKSLFFKL